MRLPTLVLLALAVALVALPVPAAAPDDAGASAGPVGTPAIPAFAVGAWVAVGVLAGVALARSVPPRTS